MPSSKRAKFFGLARLFAQRHPELFNRKDVWDRRLTIDSYCFPVTTAGFAKPSESKAEHIQEGEFLQEMKEW